MIQKTCQSCAITFSISEDDIKFLTKFSVPIPEPKDCPSCREQQRMSHRNERNFYHRKCDRTGKKILSMYSLDGPYKVYDQEVWWSDKFDPLQYGRDYDFTQPFFQQFTELENSVPKLAIINAKSENCLYTNYSAENKNCYLVVGCLGSEDCFYSYRIFYSKDICDSYDLYKCERCYECLESKNLYNCTNCTNCFSSSNLTLCKDCTGCTDCFGCVNLRNKKYFIYNREFSSADYKKKVAELRSKLGTVRLDIEILHKTEPHRFAQQVQCENVSGDQIWESKNCHDCYTLKMSQDCAYAKVSEHNKDCMDCNFCDNCELQYHSCNCEKNYNVVFSSLIWYCKDVFYSMNCFNSNHLFGCTGMKKNEYCILNKQYSKEEYQKLLPKITEHMQSTGEWAQFFPASISAFGYNETVANDYISLTKEEVVQKGWKWREQQKPHENYLGPQENTESIDEICTKILTCQTTGKQYKIIPQELSFYTSLQISIPTKCPEQRHNERMARLNPRRLWKRNCAKCSADIQTTYDPERSEKVYCETCYQESLN